MTGGGFSEVQPATEEVQKIADQVIYKAFFFNKVVYVNANCFCLDIWFYFRTNYLSKI